MSYKRGMYNHICEATTYLSVLLFIIRSLYSGKITNKVGKWSMYLTYNCNFFHFVVFETREKTNMQNTSNPPILFSPIFHALLTIQRQLREKWAVNEGINRVKIFD